MPHPPITYKTVVATYTGPDGAAIAGSLRFIPSATVLDSVGRVVVPPTPITAALNGSGYVEVELACTDVTGTTPTGWVWQLSELFSGGRETTFSLPTAGGSTVYLADLVPPESTEATYAYASQAALDALTARVTALEASVAVANAATVIHPFAIASDLI